MPEKVLNVLEITFYLFIFFAWGVRRGNASVCHRAVFILFQPVCLSSMPPPSQYRTAHSCCTSAPLTGIFLWDFVNAAHDMSSCVIMCHHMTCHRVSSHVRRQGSLYMRPPVPVAYVYSNVLICKSVFFSGDWRKQRVRKTSDEDVLY